MSTKDYKNEQKFYINFFINCLLHLLIELITLYDFRVYANLVVFYT